MQDRHPPSRIQLSSAFVAAIISSAALAVIIAMWYALQPPPSPYHGLLLLCGGGAISGSAVIAVIGLTVAVADHFRQTDEAHEAAEADHREQTRRALESIQADVAALADRQSTANAALASLDERCEHLCEQYAEVKKAVEDCEGEVATVAADLDALAATVIETGPPSRRLGTQQPRAVMGTRPGAAARTAT